MTPESDVESASRHQSVVIAAVASVVVHVVLGTLLWRKPAELVLEHEPVNVEVIRLAGVLAPSRQSPALAAEAAPKPRAPELLTQTEPRSARENRPGSAPTPAPGSSPTPAPGSSPTPAPGSSPTPAPRSSREQSRDEPPQRQGPEAADAKAPDSEEGARSSLDFSRDERGADARDEQGAALAPEPTLDTAALSRRLQTVALRCYPAAARRFRQTGQAQVRFCVDGAGALRESKVTQTAGSSLLDHAASDCVIPGAAPFGPEAFDRCFTVPVRFSP